MTDLSPEEMSAIAEASDIIEDFVNRAICSGEDPGLFSRRLEVAWILQQMALRLNSSN